MQAQQVSERIGKQPTDVTKNIIRSIGISNQVGVNAIDAARENFMIYNRTVEAVTDFNNNLLKA